MAAKSFKRGKDKIPKGRAHGDKNRQGKSTKRTFPHSARGQPDVQFAARHSHVPIGLCCLTEMTALINRIGSAASYNEEGEREGETKAIAHDLQQNENRRLEAKLKGQ